jgi:hypothetical protein
MQYERLHDTFFGATEGTVRNQEGMLLELDLPAWKERRHLDVAMNPSVV